MASSINDIINQAVQNSNQMQQANQQLNSILGNSSNASTTGSQSFSPSNIFLSQYPTYKTLMTEDPTSSTHSHGKVVATYLSRKVPEQINQLIQSGANSISPILQQDYQQATTALNQYISNQQNLAPALFANTWESPVTNPESINISMAGNQIQNQTLAQYNQKYNQQQQSLDTQKQNFLNNLSNMKTQIQSYLDQFNNPDTAKVLVVGMSASYLQNVYNRISPYLTPDSYNQMVKNLQDIYSNDNQFAQQYNKLFQNYLGMNINLIDQLQQNSMSDQDINYYNTLNPTKTFFGPSINNVMPSSSIQQQIYSNTVSPMIKNLVTTYGLPTSAYNTIEQQIQQPQYQNKKIKDVLTNIIQQLYPTEYLNYNQQ